MNQDLTRLERFDGNNFTRWKETVLFFLTTVNMSYIISKDLEPIPKDKEGDDEAKKKELKEQRQKRKTDEFLCRGHILNQLVDSVYSAHRTTEGGAKTLWDAVDKKYRIEEASNQKFLISNYIDYKMSDSYSVVTQEHELGILVSKLKDAKINLPEAFQVGVVIEKLPNSWNSYKKKLKHEEETHTLCAALQQNDQMKKDTS
ncbi:uncharacterized protein LOC113338638 [Papaver somniferum]|uniref:uncharacterized protein LOC113338638 n=1 Tax=Papaver somniferum TaxID=3469 RepID=UPI000E6FACFF|nr:uncharacterized protein LOC113338638 [Papaver somniferum]